MRTALRKARVQAHLTQKEMAERIGVTLRHYNAIESGLSFGSIQVWERIRDVLGGTIDALLENNVTDRTFEVNNFECRQD